ncbi:MAG: AraC family transcriptional regulator [Lachnospiraceae bacterium]|nr:AraC family transcriptional regulator [Lachnospiraceae bacterium]
MKLRKNLEEQRMHGELGFNISMYYNQSAVGPGDFLAPLHYHTEFEFLAALEGEICVPVEEQEVRVQEGEGVFINSSRLHSIRAEGGAGHHILAVVFAPDFLASREERIFKKYLYNIMENRIEVPMKLETYHVQSLKLLYESYERQEYGFEITLKSRLLAIMGDLVAHSSARDDARIVPRYESIKSVLAYIEENYMNEIMLEDLAKTAGLSREHFCRVFSEVADVSAITYLNRFRIQKSMELLKNTDQTISEISAACGFNNCSYYNKLFRRFVCETPKQYRKYRQA